MKELENIEHLELLGYCPAISLYKPDSKIDLNDIVELSSKGGPIIMASISKDQNLPDNRPEKKYWSYVKNEIDEIACGKSKKYEKLRSSIKQSVDKGKQGIIPVIAASVGSKLGLEAGIIASWVALAIFSIQKIGLNAYCKMLEEINT